MHEGDFLVLRTLYATCFQQFASSSRCLPAPAALIGRDMGCGTIESSAVRWRHSIKDAGGGVRVEQRKRRGFGDRHYRAIAVAVVVMGLEDGLIVPYL